MRKALFACAALLIWHTSASFAAETPAVCDTPQAVTEKLIASSGAQGWIVGVYDEVTDAAQVAEFVAAFNAAPPASNIAADMVMLYTARRASSGQTDGNALAIYFNGGCQVPKAGFMLTRQAVDKILGPQA